MSNNMIFAGVDSKPINSVMEHVYTNPMDTIRESSEDVHVRRYVAYGNPSNGKLYYEPTYKTQVSTNDAKDAFDKGLLMVVDVNADASFTPVCMIDNTVFTVAGSTTASTTQWKTKSGTESGTSTPSMPS